MAFKYPTGKFDDATKTVSQDVKKVYPAFPREYERRALQGVLNRIIAGTSGTDGGTSFNVGCGTGSTGGVAISCGVTLLINGRMGTLSAPQANLEFPAGTQSAATWVKYLISSGFGSSGTVTAGNEGTSATHARLPDCPNNHVALGYMCYQANGTRGWIRTNSVCSGVAAGTNGTVNEWVNLVHMPLDED